MDKRFLSLFFLFLLFFVIFASLVVFNKPLTRLIRANEEYNTISTENSSILAWPMTVKADGRSESAIRVFLSSEAGPPITNKLVSLKSTLGVIKEGSLDKAIEDKHYYEFHLVSPNEGVATVEAMVDGVSLIHKVSVVFIK
jgi:hypothetical protein